jgi:rhodanese-related sulfurtransferase
MINFLKNLFGKSADVKEILAQGATIIDVRTPNEYKGGHAKKSVNIPLNTIEANIGKIKKYNQPIVTCCASGMRSGRAAGILKSKGIEAYNGGPWQNVR